MNDSTRSIDPTDLGLGPVRPIPWERFKAEVLAAWPGPPLCSKTHAWTIRRTLAMAEALDLAGPGEDRRTARDTADLTVGLVAKFVATAPPHWSAYTLKARLSCLRTVCSFAEQNRWMTVSPFRLRKLSRFVRTGPPVDKRHATREEIRRVLDVMAKDVAERRGWAQWRARRLYAVTSLIVYTGLRRNEALLLHVVDVDFAAGIINLVPRDREFKTVASAQPVPMPAALVPILRDWFDHRLDAPRGYPMPPATSIPWLFPTISRKAPWISGSLASRAINRLKAVAARAGAPDMTFQMLRRSWATHAEFFGVPPAMIQRVLRHTQARTTEMFYRKADRANMTESVRDMRF